MGRLSAQRSTLHTQRKFQIQNYNIKVQNVEWHPATTTHFP